MPEEVMPNRGPKAGGTLITISGLFLNAGSKEDVQVTIGGVNCSVEHFGENITCRTGEYRVDKVPSDPLDVVMKYGKRTTKSIPATFRFVENPTVQDHQPKTSFVCGGRNIMVTGTRFDIIQTAIMKVQGRDWSSSEFAHKKNATVIQFQSPTVNGSADQHLKTVIKLDNWEKELKPFFYHPNPSFNNLQNKIITANSMIIVTGRGFSKAMTAKEAQAFVGDVQYVVNTLQDDKLFLEPPSSPPRAHSTQVDVKIKFGKGVWVVGSMEFEDKNYSLYMIIRIILLVTLVTITISVYCATRAQLF
ncbi:plexin-B2 [Haplochromis burtoni]|uniref:plexin-B2 n=1 Tax=Haplochromis burtoni TaxID=8153 RepID=UPI001C2CC8CA|nr:plexin-B2 [Haplochromis burtoni]